MWHPYAVTKTVGADDNVKGAVCRALTKAPATVVDELMEKCVIIAVVGDCWGSFFDRGQLSGKDLIVLFGAIVSSSEETVTKRVLHEVAHFWLSNHPREIVSRDSAIHAEAEADALVEEWLAEVAL